MITKDNLAGLRTELVEFVAGEFATFRAEDIEPMKRDIARLKQDVEKIRNAFAPRLEHDDRLRVVEQKLGSPGLQ